VSAADRERRAIQSGSSKENIAAELENMTPSVPDYLSPIQWQQAIAVSRQECARIFRDGGTPQDALIAFRLRPDESANWERVVDLVAGEIFAHPAKRAA
jgi:hypothetical protein